MEEHPEYKRLGGFLKFIVVMQYLSAVAIVVSVISGIVAMAQYARLYRMYGMSTARIWLAIILFAGLACVYVPYALKVAKMIRQKDSDFLRVQHLFTIISAAILILVQLLTSGAGDALSQGISLAISLAINTLYYMKSVRVHVYMGSEEYLWRSPITRFIQQKHGKKHEDGTSAVLSDSLITNTDAFQKLQQMQKEVKNTVIQKMDEIVQQHKVEQQENHPQEVETTSAVKAASPVNIQSPLVFQKPDACCICGQSLDDGYAVLFKDQQGKEMKIDEACWKEIDILHSSSDRQLVERALAYFHNKTISENVQNELSRYIWSGEHFLETGTRTKRRRQIG